MIVTETLAYLRKADKPPALWAAEKLDRSDHPAPVLFVSNQQVPELIEKGSEQDLHLCN